MLEPAASHADPHKRLGLGQTLTASTSESRVEIYSMVMILDPKPGEDLTWKFAGRHPACRGGGLKCKVNLESLHNYKRARTSTPSSLEPFLFVPKRRLPAVEIPVEHNKVVSLNPSWLFLPDKFHVYVT